MKTTEFKETPASWHQRRRRHVEDRLYPNVAESRRLEKAYVELELDARVLRAQPLDDRFARRREG